MILFFDILGSQLQFHLLFPILLVCLCEFIQLLEVFLVIHKFNSRLF